MMPKDIDWRDRAECLGMDFDLFFPGQGESPREALTACRRCAVARHCLSAELQLSTAHQHGVFGETTAMERIRMKRNHS